MRSVCLRALKPGEENALYAMICELAAFEGKDVSSLPLTPENLQRFGFGAKPFFHTQAALVDDKPVGYASYCYTFSAHQGYPVLYLEDLYVAPEYRRKGIGKAILSKLAQYAAVWSGMYSAGTKKPLHFMKH